MKKRNKVIEFIINFIKGDGYDLKKLEVIQKYHSPVNDVLITQQNIKNYMIR